MKKALLVGINRYPRGALRGCVNDCLLMYKILSEKFEFVPEYMDILTDEESTKNNIIFYLKKLIDDAKYGDTLFFHYSGHGSQVSVNDWTDSYEVDGRDEILCPIDMNWNDPLRDNEIGDLIRSVPHGVKVVVVLDCCHSGTGLRNAAGTFEFTTSSLSNDSNPIKPVVNRFLEPPPSNILRNPMARIDTNLDFSFPDVDDSRIAKRSFLVSTVAQGEAILISGCQDNQTSADAFLNGKFRGALSYSIFHSLLDSNFNLTYKELIVKVNKYMDRKGFVQNPQLECVHGYEHKKFLG